MMKKTIASLLGMLLVLVALTGPKVAAQDVRRSLTTLTNALVKLQDGSVTLPSLTFANNSGLGLYSPSPIANQWFFTAAGTARFGMIGTSVLMGSDETLNWTSTTSATASADLTLARDLPNTLALRSGTNAQTFNIYSTYTDASNYERLEFIATAAGNPVIGARKAGTGTQRGIELRGNIAGAGWLIDTSNNIVDQGAHTITSGGLVTATNFGFNSSGARGFINAPADGVHQLINAASNGFTRLILGTNDTAASGLGLVNNAGGLDVKTGDGTAYRDINLRALGQTGKTTTYNSVTTTGWGVPAIYGTGRFTAQNAAKASVATYTVGGVDGSFEVSANVLVTTATTHSFGVSVVYTDEGNTVRTVFMSFYTAAGFANGAAAIINANGAVPYMGVPLHIRAKASTAITIASSGTFTTVTYNVEGIIKQTA